MRDFDETTITQAVLDRLASTPDPRLHAILRSLVVHLHDFVRDARPTVEEWSAAIQFLTRVGQTCTDTRQEFILLSDTLGVSMLVDAINHGQAGGVTESTVLGPFYVEAAPEVPAGADVSGGLDGEPLLVEGTVGRADGTPVAGAIVDIWHSDRDGFYDVQRADLDGPALRARLTTDSGGRFRFWSIVPSHYPIPDDGPVGDLLKASARHPFRPAHVHFRIQAPGCATLVTHLFAEGGDYLDSDAVFAVKQSLVVPFIEAAAGRAPDGRVLDRPWRRLAYDFRLAAA